MFPLKPKQVPHLAKRAKNAEAHTSPDKHGMGNYYGTGFRAPIGRIRDATVGFRPAKNLGTPPKSVV